MIGVSAIARGAWSSFKLVQIRLRVPIALLAAAVVVGRWESIQNAWDSLGRRLTVESLQDRAVSNDTEYFCPMDPGVVSDWPSKCGVCNMALVRRKRGEAVALPSGVVARMQLSPARIQLANIQTTAASFQALSRIRETEGVVARVEGALAVVARVPARDRAWIVPGRSAQAWPLGSPGVSSSSAKVARVELSESSPRASLRIVAVFDLVPEWSREGVQARLVISAPLADLEPFRSLPENPPRLEVSEPRRVYVCPSHPESIGFEAGVCGLDGRERVPEPLGEFDRARYWCPMHPEVESTRPGVECKACGGMPLVPRVVVYRPPGRVLAVPRSALVEVDSEGRGVVYVESAPGMFDGVSVVVGPRCGDDYPVVSGLAPGARVATSGAFLLDAETRLNPGLASAYFGAGRNPREGAAQGSLVPASVDLKALALGKLAPADQALVRAQARCPVTGKDLGSMGVPIRMVADGKPVFLCCEGCRDAFQSKPGQYLTKPTVAKP